MPDLRHILTAVPLLAALALPGQAQTIRLTEPELIDLVRALEASASPLKRVAISGVPSGFGSGEGILQFALTGTNRRIGSTTDRYDGSFAVTYGLGNPVEAVSLDVSAVISSIAGDSEGLSDFPKGFGNAGFFSARVSRRFDMGTTLISAGVGADYIAGWGDAQDFDTTYHAALSTLSHVHLGGSSRFPLLTSVGWGTAVADMGQESGAFAALGLGLSPQFSISAGWMADRAVLGTTYWTHAEGDPHISLSLDDAFNDTGNRRVNFDLAWAFDTKGWFAQ